ncbi:hypothetical protein [Nocardia salmonicida]|uniref:hypothetical protein n=1 Tax=Nocardia salmonicida TaxID=53431 RepID=UPI0007A4D6B0|nr:hypothetical protein [Nocardia salmonicida]MBC7299503.1 hypothetical protein [Nocardia sp.]
MALQRARAVAVSLGLDVGILLLRADHDDRISQVRKMFGEGGLIEQLDLRSVSVPLQASFAAPLTRWKAQYVPEFRQVQVFHPDGELIFDGEMLAQDWWFDVAEREDGNGVVLILPIGQAATLAEMRAAMDAGEAVWARVQWQELDETAAPARKP